MPPDHPPSVPCAYCLEGRAPRRAQCPKSGGACDWCCDSCSGARCARGVEVTLYPAAAHWARYMTLPAGASSAECLTTWGRVYSAAHGVRPGAAEYRSARGVLAHRLSASPLPPPRLESRRARWPRFTAFVVYGTEGTS